MMIAGDKKMMIFFNSSLKTRWFTPGITTPGSWNPCTGCCSSSSVSCLLFSWSAVWFLRAILVSHEEEFPPVLPSLHLLLMILRSFWLISFLSQDHHYWSFASVKVYVNEIFSLTNQKLIAWVCSALLDLIFSLIYFFVSDLLFIPCCCRDCKIQDNLEGRCLFLTRRCFKELLVISFRQTSVLSFFLLNEYNCYYFSMKY